MRHFRASILLLGLIFSSAALAELKVYDVDVKYRQEVFAALRSVLSTESPMTASGTVAMLPTGQILIDTSAGGHAQVAAVLDAINARQAEAAPRVTLRYWAVLGSREAAGGSAPPPILSDVLDELRRVHGDLEFGVVGNATLVTESGQSGSLDGQPLSVHQQAYVQGETLNTQLSISFFFEVPTGQAQSPDGGNVFQATRRERQQVTLSTSLERDEFVVVGENTIGQNTINQGELHGTIFYIVHWPAD